MNKEAKTRRENLRRLLHRRGWSYKELVARAGKSYPYWRDLVTDENKSFGEKAARSLEASLDLPKMWLDGQAPVPPWPAEYKRIGKAEETQDGWPFEKIDLSKVQSLARDDLLRLEGMLITLATSIGIDVANELAA